MLPPRSEEKLLGVHPDLVRVIRLAAEKEPIIVTCGLRTLSEQKALKAAGKSKTLNSRHLTGHAIDIVDADGHYDMADMARIAGHIKAAAAELNIPVEWGGDWKGAWDTPHFQLSWKAYPAGNGGLSLAQKAGEAVKTKPAVAVAAASTAAATDPVSVATAVIPSPPDLSGLSAWQAAGEQIASLGSWAWQRPIASLALIGWCALAYLWPSQNPKEGEA